MHHFHRYALICVAVLLSACGGPTQADVSATITAAIAALPTQTPAIVTRVVERVVTATPAPTATLPPSTPTPVVAAHEATIRTATSIYTQPDTSYSTVTDLAAGATITVQSRVNGWFEVKTDGKTGWVPAETVSVEAESVPVLKGVKLVISGEIVQDFLADKVLFKGRVRNVGFVPAESVAVEIELQDNGGARLELSKALVDGLDIPAGEERSFTVIANDVPDWKTYVSTLTWRE